VRRGRPPAVGARRSEWMRAAWGTAGGIGEVGVERGGGGRELSSGGEGSEQEDAQTFVAYEWWKQLQVSAHRAAWSQVLAHASVPLVTVWCMASTWSSNGAGFWVKMRAILALQSILRLVDATVHPFSPRWEGNVHLVASLVELGVVNSLNLGCRQSIATLMSPRISVGLAYLSKASTVPAGVDSGGHADDAGASASPAHTLNNTYTRNTLTHTYTNTAPACALPVFCKHTLPLKVGMCTMARAPDADRLSDSASSDDADAEQQQSDVIANRHDGRTHAPSKRPGSTSSISSYGNDAELAQLLLSRTCAPGERSPVLRPSARQIASPRAASHYSRAASRSAQEQDAGEAQVSLARATRGHPVLDLTASPSAAACRRARTMQRMVEESRFNDHHE